MFIGQESYNRKCHTILIYEPNKSVINFKYVYIYEIGSFGKNIYYFLFVWPTILFYYLNDNSKVKKNKCQLKY